VAGTNDTARLAGNPLTLTGNLIINSGNKFDAGANNLNTTVGANWTNNGGNFLPGTASVTFNSANKTIVTTPFSSVRDVNGSFGGETFYKLYMNKTNSTDSVRLAGNITIANEIGFVKGAFDCNIGDVTILSNKDITAHVARIVTLSDVSLNYRDTGKFIIQRHLPIDVWATSRKWRLLTAPVNPSSTNDISMNRAWMEGAVSSTVTTPVNPQPRFGTLITNGNTSAAVANGFDLGVRSNPSIYYMSPGPSPSWVAPASTYTSISAQRGYMIFVRGHRGIAIGDQNTNPDSTTLEPMGRISIGDTTIPIVQGSQVIGNPYASAVNFNTMLYNGVTPGSGFRNYYLWDPRIYGAYGVGQWVTFSSNGDGTYHRTPTPASTYVDGVIESGSAFLIRAASAGTLVIHESDKLTSSSTGGIASRPMGISTPSIDIDMYIKNTDGSKYLMDGVAALYNTGFNDIVDEQDASKISTFTGGERISILRGSEVLSVERRQTMDTVFLRINRLNTEPHQLAIAYSNAVGAYPAYLQDKYLGKDTALTLNGTTYYDFSTTADVASGDTDRFRIVFRPTVVLPVKYSLVRASEHSSAIAVDWKVENGGDTREYVIEHSTDGITFTKAGSVAGTGMSSSVYSWLDAAPAGGNNYYRIQSIGIDGSAAGYSQVVMVRGGDKTSAVKVVSTIIKNNSIGLQFTNQQAGIYHVNLYNSLGQNVYKTMLTGYGESWGETLALKNNLAKGIYNLEIISPDKKITTLKVIAE
jgi:hypothetical protein